MAEPADDCCRCCFSFILTSGLTALFLWLSLRTYSPTFSIEQFYIPSLNLSSPNSSHPNRTIDFRLQLRNNMKDKGVRYSNISLGFSYLIPAANASPVPLAVANFTIPHFNQGHGKKAQRRQLANVSTSMPWPDAITALRNGTGVTFRVDLRTRVKYKIVFWYTKRHTLNVAGDVPVDNSGDKDRKKHKKGVKLNKSGAPLWTGVGCYPVFNLLVILFLLHL